MERILDTRESASIHGLDAAAQGQAVGTSGVQAGRAFHMLLLCLYLVACRAVFWFGTACSLNAYCRCHGEPRSVDIYTTTPVVDCRCADTTAAFLQVRFASACTL